MFRKEIGYKPIIAVMRIGEWLIENMDVWTVNALSIREQHRLSRFKHQQRRIESLASRIVAKYLFLSQLRQDTANSGKGRDDVNCYSMVLPIHLVDFSFEEYRQIEILPPNNRHAPHLVWKGSDMSDLLSSSISHTGGWTAVAISMNCPVGIDMELILPRSNAFLRGCFSEAEHSWVYLSSKTVEISSHWLYTFLWTLKEAAFKTGLSKRFPARIGVLMQGSISKSLQQYNEGQFIFAMPPLQLLLETGNTQRLFEATCRGTSDFLLTAVHPL